MFNTYNAVFAACAGTAIWWWLGYGLGRFVFSEHVLRFTAAPVLGWAVYTAISIPIFYVIGFSPVSVFFTAAAALAASYFLSRKDAGRTENARALPLVALVAAGVIALVPSFGTMMPKYHHPEGIVLADPISDRAKVAIVDEIARGHLPPDNPFYGETGQNPELVYYWGWHSSAAQLSYLPEVSGWEADAALSWFTSFSSLLLLMGLAVWLCGAPMAAGWVAALSISTNIRPILALILGPERLQGLISGDADLGAWLNHAPWVPMHVASASCVVLAMVLIVRLASDFRVALLLGVVAAAAFGTSTYVGGFVFPLAAAVAGLIFLFNSPNRLRLSLHAIIAAAVAIGFALPFALPQIAAVSDLSAPAMAFWQFTVLGFSIQKSVRQALDPFVYWLFFLVEFPAVYLLGVLGAIYVFRKRLLDRDRMSIAIALVVLTLSGMAITACLKSIISSNDLGWRAIIAPSMALTVFAAAALAQWFRGKAVATVGIVLFALGLSYNIIYYRALVVGHAFRADPTFAEAPALWEAVRRHAGRDDRVASNPLLYAKVTPWPTNISWGLMSNRRSCFAARTLVVAYSGRPADLVNSVGDVFDRVFAGVPAPTDIEQLAVRHQCHVLVFVPTDGAWLNDPLAANAFYKIVEQTDRWRIYEAVDLPPPPPPAVPGAAPAG